MLRFSQTDASLFMEKGKEKSSKKGKKEEDKTKTPSTSINSQHEGEYKKGVKMVLWLTPEFPLKTEELIPLLDILENTVKIVWQLRDMFTTKLPFGTFLVKVNNMNPFCAPGLNVTCTENRLMH